MALTNSFLLATNTALTLEFSGYEDTIHKSDLSDNPQDLPVLYIGSVNTSRKLQATSNPGIDNILLIPSDIMPTWAAAASVSLGTVRQPTVANTYVYTAIVAGTSSATQPTWPTTIGSTVTDGTVTWQCTRKKHLTTEIVLALTSGGLATNTPGGTLSLGNTILGGTSNKVSIYIRVINAVTMPSNSTSQPDVAILINGVSEFTV